MKTGESSLAGRVVNNFMLWQTKGAQATKDKELYIYGDTLRTGHNVLYNGSVVAVRYKREKPKLTFDFMPRTCILVNQHELPKETIWPRRWMLTNRTIGRVTHQVDNAESPSKSLLGKVGEWDYHLDQLRRTRTIKGKMRLFRTLVYLAKTIRSLESFFNLRRNKLEIPEDIIAKLVVWQMDGEPIGSQWKSLLEIINGKREGSERTVA